MSHRYFTDRIENGAAFLDGEDAVHLARVLRCRPGELLTLCDGAGTDYAARVTAVRADEIALEVLSSRPTASEAGLWVTLYVGLPKGDKFELILQKAAELGAAAIVPFTSEFCVARPKNEDAKLVRWQRILCEAAKQSGRGRIPAVRAAIPCAQMCREAAAADAALFCYEGGGEHLVAGGSLHSRLAGAKTAAVITGAEGGFSAAEAQTAQDAGCTAVSLGPRILRCETAPLAALAAVMALTGNL